MKDKDLEFVVRHYRHDTFSTSAAWKRLGIGRGTARRLYLRIAASAAIVLALGSTAAILINTIGTDTPKEERPVPAATATPLPATPEAVRVIDFSDAPLATVVEKIESTYGIKVEGMSEKNKDIRLTLRYEGNAADLLEAINDILGTHLTIKSL